MSHPETMLNVLRHCVKLLRQQQSKEFPLKEILRVCHGLRIHPTSSRTAELPQLPTTNVATARQQSCLWRAMPFLKYCQLPVTLQVTPSKNYWPFSLEISFFYVVSQD